MKLLKTIEKLIQESEEAYNKALENYSDERTVTRLEKNYNEALKLLRVFNEMKLQQKSKK